MYVGDLPQTSHYSNLFKSQIFIYCFTYVIELLREVNSSVSYKNTLDKASSTCLESSKYTLLFCQLLKMNQVTKQSIIDLVSPLICTFIFLSCIILICPVLCTGSPTFTHSSVGKTYRLLLDVSWHDVKARQLYQIIWILDAVSNTSHNSNVSISAYQPT